MKNRDIKKNRVANNQFQIVYTQNVTHNYATLQEEN